MSDIKSQAEALFQELTVHTEDVALLLAFAAEVRRQAVEECVQVAAKHAQDLAAVRIRHYENQRDYDSASEAAAWIATRIRALAVDGGAGAMTRPAGRA